MSQFQSVEKSSPSSTVSSNCESPPLTKISKNKSEQHIIQKPNALSPAVVFAQILLHILSENKKSNDYYKKISLNKDGHFTFKVQPSIPLFVYLQRILKYVRVEFSTLIIAMIYRQNLSGKSFFE